jgi:1,4-dihydroxy-2-naphthoate octaprenyltransferase
VKGKTIYLSLVWTYASCILPFLLAYKSLTWQHIFFIVYRFMFIYVVCFLFDYKDSEEDKAAGIKSFIHQLNLKQAQQLVYLLLLFAGLFNAGLFGFIPFDIWLFQFAVLILLWKYLKYFLKNKRDIIYYGILDGLVFIVPIYVWVRNLFN